MKNKEKFILLINSWLNQHQCTQFQTSEQNKHENKKSLVCSHCKKPGHTIAKCYRLHGFPKDFKFTKPRKYAANVSMEEQELFEESAPKTVNSNNCFSVEQYKELI
ncbi:putative transcription factor interactor and regulator CCHC(Zn) family [Helianthus annuus]|nr:putative transcription factor interactor and regulator CCHC(Zn) family [Helianthus annuus]KAJ0498356.1 putative transcription factor interactor and regulator CCHC(Zn) family [Helianthus annuus]KAJ0664366.1 putative transcription factor interactor and regulator CCHC(Zn) family [Helianthus annuus]